MMGNRVVYGNSFSENGWPMVDEASCTWVSVPGCDVTLELQNGQPLQILRAFAADFNAYVEPLRDADSAGWTPTNSVASSNHLSGTAVDLNWDSHPFQVLNAGFSEEAIAKVRGILAFYEDTVFWGNDWDTPKDAMHFQVGYDTYNNPKTADFIQRKIRADGFSTYQRGSASGPPADVTADAAQILSDVMGARLTLDRYRELLPAVSESLSACECTSVDRIAMWCAQIGHESGGLYYTEEIASGEAYEGRADLGNTEPGDGVRFKGRSWIQITGRSNYTRLSQWAFEKGLVPTPAYFVDNPTELASDEYAGLGAAWYWVVARPDINALSDAKDVVMVTTRINGGQNGIADRQQRYAAAQQIGDKLLSLVQTNEGVMADVYLTEDEQHELLDGVRWIKQQLGPNIWEAASSFGKDDSGHELTLRDGLASLKRTVENNGVGLSADQLSEVAKDEIASLAKSILTELAAMETDPK